MAMKYWRVKIKGRRSTDGIHSAIGRSGGEILRIHFERGETHVYFAAEKIPAAEAARGLKKGAKPQEIGAEDLTRFE